MRIAVGFLRSDEGQVAFQRAIEEARERNASLTVVHSMRGGERDEADTVIAYNEAFEEAEEELRGTGIDYEVKRFARGNSPAEDLLQCAKDEDVDLIVIGIRRRSPVGKLLLGSNAQDVILHADCAVLCVKP
jgi:nucleotide-binding universal stress UspA family protein